MLGLCSQAPGAVARLEANIVDDATGEPLAARVAVTNADGKFLEIEGKHEHVQYLGKRWCYVDGSFALALPDSEVELEIRRGFETRPLSAKIAASASGKPIQKTFRLRRWIDMRRQGYANGDIHAHLPVPKEAHPQMRAEDLSAQVLLYLPDTENPWAINKCFTGRLDANSTPGCEIYVGQEVQDWQMGHLNMLGLTKLVPGYPRAGGTLEYWTSRPQWDLIRAMRAVRQQNGTVFWPHMSSLPGAQLPIALALGLVDGIELITWNDPTQLPNHWGPWLNSGMSQAEFPVLRGVDLYYQYLNAGFRVPIAAGTDKFAEEIPLGSNRVYAKVQGPATYAAWLEAVKAGKGFVTNGPILEFQAADADPGRRNRVQGYQAHQGPRDGPLHPALYDPGDRPEWRRRSATRRSPIPNNAPKDGLYSMEGRGHRGAGQERLAGRPGRGPSGPQEPHPAAGRVRLRPHRPDLLPPGRPQGPRGGVDRLPPQVRQRRARTGWIRIRNSPTTKTAAKPAGPPKKP